MAYTVSKEKKEEWQQKAVENQNKAKALIKKISDGFTNEPEQIAELLEFASRFYKYSIGNTELVKAQNPGATYVQSYNAWKKEGIHINKNETGLKIWVPVVVTVLFPPGEKPVALSEATDSQKADYECGLIPAKKTTKFKIGTVFDIGQTDYPKEKLPEFFSMGYSSENHALISKGLIRFCEAHGCDVSSENLGSISIRGYYDGNSNKIAMNILLQDTQYLSTLSHEMGHMLQKHVSVQNGIDRTQKEFEADCISVVLQSFFGVELTDSRKSHLAEHYRSYLDWLLFNQPNISKEDQIKSIDAIMDNALSTFRTYADEIREFVDKELEEKKEASVSVSNRLQDYEQTESLLALRHRRGR